MGDAKGGTVGDGAWGEGRSRAGTGRCSEVGRGRGFPAVSQAWNLSGRILSLSATEQRALGPAVSPARPGGLALTGPLVRSGFPTANSEVIPKLFWFCLCVFCIPRPSIVVPALSTLQSQNLVYTCCVHGLTSHSFLKPLSWVFCVTHPLKLLKPRSPETSM